MSESKKSEYIFSDFFEPLSESDKKVKIQKTNFHQIYDLNVFVNLNNK